MPLRSVVDAWATKLRTSNRRPVISILGRVVLCCCAELITARAPHAIALIGCDNVNAVWWLSLIHI